MKKLTQLIKESIDSMTWGEFMNKYQNDIDFINCDAESILSKRWKMESDVDWRTMDSKSISGVSGASVVKLTNNITIYDEYDFILVCKNNDPLAFIVVYEPQGFNSFKNIVVMYGHEEIVFYDTDDFTHKKIYTR